MVNFTFIKNIFLHLFICNLILCSIKKELPLASIMDINSRENYTFANCFLFDQRDWVNYDLTSLGDDKDNEIFHNITVTHDSFTLYFRFCENVNYKCDNKKGLVAAKYNDGTCKVFTESNDRLKKWSYKINPNNTMSITLKMETEEKCTGKKNFTTKFVFNCDENMQIDKFVLDSGKNTDDFIYFSKEYSSESGDNRKLPINCERKLTFASKNACPRFDMYPAWNFYITNSSVFGMLLILCGFYTLFFGFKNKTLTTYIYGVYGVIIIFYIFFVLVRLDIKYIYLLWLAHILLTAIGILLSAYINNTKKVKIAFFGALMGISLSNLLYYIIIVRIPVHPFLLFFVSIAASIIIIPILFVLLFDIIWAMIISTSVCGSYLIIRGIATYAGGMPYVGYILDLIDKKEYQVLSLNIEIFTTYFYSCTCIVLSFLGIFSQYKQKGIEDYGKQRKCSTKVLSPGKEILIQDQETN